MTPDEGLPPDPGGVPREGQADPLLKERRVRSWATWIAAIAVVIIVGVVLYGITAANAG